MENKQSMKLYTEEELRKHLYNHSDEFFEQLTPIELPSDEEIKKESKYKSRYILPLPLQWNPVLNIVYIEGAKWMRDKIQGGNK